MQNRAETGLKLTLVRMLFSKKKKSLFGNYSRILLLGLNSWLSLSEVALSQSLDLKWAAFQEEARAIVRPLQVPGGVMGLMVGDSLVALSAWGWANIARQIPMRPDHLFPIASISKTFAAVRALQLVAEGKLSLQTPARQYLPGYGLPDTVRIHHLFHQTSEGKPGHFLLMAPDLDG
ncbi:MAG: beta-lactamase family protein [Microscillaceae bacterium]|nr:beta-lactamase family protein [Microscillaceae bacterium]